MLIGYTCNAPNENNCDLMLLTVDTLGNEVNRVVWGGGALDLIYSSLAVNGTVLMVGYTKSFQGSDTDTWIVSTDSIGNILWYQVYNHLSPSGSDAASSIMALPDGNFAMVGSFEVGASEISDSYLMKIDPLGNEIWTKRFEIPENQGPWACVALEDGNMLFSGQTTYTDDDSQAGWLVKTTANGDTLWTRTYNPSSSIDLIRDMLVMPNGDIIMVGFGRGENSTTQDGWILRVDSMGCELEGCFTVGINDELSIKNEELKVWPNPVSDMLNMAFSIHAPSGRALEVTVFDAVGRRVHSETLRFAQENNRMDVSNWTNGIYLITLSDDDGNRYTERFVVQH